MSNILPDVSIKPSQQEIIDEQTAVNIPREEHIFEKPHHKETINQEVQEDEAVEVEELPCLKRDKPTSYKNDNHNLTIPKPAQDYDPQPEKPTKKRGRPKGTLTQQQLDNLQRGRLVSASIRKAKADERKKEKQMEKIEKNKMLNNQPYNPELIPKLKGRIVSEQKQDNVGMTIYKQATPEPEKNMKPSQTSSFDYDILAEKVASRLKPKPPPQPVQPPKPQVDKQRLLEVEKKIREDERARIEKEQKQKEEMNRRRQQYMKGLPMTNNTVNWDSLFG